MKNDSTHFGMNDEVNPIIRAMSPSQKLNAAWRLNVSARQLKAAALRDRHPDWTEEQIRLAVREAFMYGRY